MNSLSILVATLCLAQIYADATKGGPKPQLIVGGKTLYKSGHGKDRGVSLHAGTPIHNLHSKNYGYASQYGHNLLPQSNALLLGQQGYGLANQHPLLGYQGITRDVIGYGNHGRLGGLENIHGQLSFRPQFGHRAQQHGYVLNQQGLGLNYHGLGLNHRGLGLNQQGLGLSHHGIGLNHHGLGLNYHGLGLNHRGLGLNQQGLRVNHRGLGLNYHGLGLNHRGLGLNQHGLGFNQHGFGLNQQRFGLNQHRFGLNQHGLGLNQHILGFNQHGLGVNQHLLRHNQHRLGLSHELNSGLIHDLSNIGQLTPQHYQRTSHTRTYPAVTSRVVHQNKIHDSHLGLVGSKIRHSSLKAGPVVQKTVEYETHHPATQRFTVHKERKYATKQGEYSADDRY